MFKKLTIRQRILITFMAIVVAGGVLQLVIAGYQLQLATLEFYQHHLELDAFKISEALTAPLEEYIEGEGPQTIQNALIVLQREHIFQSLILDNSFQVIGYTAGLGATFMDTVPITPELSAAQKGELGAHIRKDAKGVTRLYVAVAIRHESNIIGYIVLSTSMQPAYDEIGQRWLQLGSTTLPVIALTAFASLWISGTISRPIKQLRNSALRMASGELHTRLEHNRADEIGQLAHAFNFMAEQIENLMKTQRSFVSNAAHELRTPLMTLKLRTEALEEGVLPAAERAVYLADLRSEIDHMAELVSSLLILARVDEGRHLTEGQITDTPSTIQDIARHWRIEARHAGLDFEADIPTDLPSLPIGPNDLRLVLDNLFSNAIKYTHKGGISLRVALASETKQIVFSVKDTGIGFEPEEGDLIFTRFFRTDLARADFEGHGLGLSIVKAVLDQYGGQVQAVSDGRGKGATFTVYLPLQEKVSIALPLFTGERGKRSTML